ncbi:MAG: N-acetylmuramic acid 6-phosphate etherase [Blastocatellia bacterium]|jgi:N-acetylmuramic acid 6-phosphate etherase|nr:N-acetylmuramic acid 6-phosphate etherase [Blastocatellia bacterium]
MSLPITEQENPRTSEIGSLPTAEIVRLMNEEDARVALAVASVLAEVALAVEGIVERLKTGGRLFYVGTGTSGRLGVLDAAECPPTFGVSPELVQGVIAGGYDATHRAVEASEDDRAAGALDLKARGLTSLDAVVGIAASGRTPYTVGAVEHARSVGAFTVAVTCVPDSALVRVAEVSIVVVVGPEAIAGSTRLKAGTAQKMILNMLSTATMIRLGYVSGNRMSNMKARNAKLRERAVRILCVETKLDETQARLALDAAGNDLSVALVMSRTLEPRAVAESALAEAHGVVEGAVENLARRHSTDGPQP